MTLIEERGGSDTPAADGSGLDPFVQFAFVHQALDEYRHVDLTEVDDEWFAEVVAAGETLKLRVEAVTVEIAAEAQRRRSSFAAQGFFSTKAYLAHHGHVSGPEAHIRLQIMRMFELLPDWKLLATTGDGRLGVDAVRLMARVASNPRIHGPLVENSGALLLDAQMCPFHVFEERVRTFARLADPDGAEAAAEKNHEARDVTLKQRLDGSWHLWGSFGSLQGAQINEVLAWFNQAEFDTDRAALRERTGDEEPSFSDLDRTESQRRADALHEALQRAASSPTDGATPIPCLNVLIDEATLDMAFTGATSDPERYRDMVCRTQNGDEIDVSEAASLALFAHIRRVVVDAAGVIVDLGRKSRIFRGNSRDAALLMSARCIWPGCDRRVRRCQADHNVEWQHLGATAPDNAACLCGRHNRHKTSGRFSVRRLDDGDWLILDALGQPVGEPDRR